MKTYRVSYRIVPHTVPHAAIVLSYVVDAINEMAAEGSVIEIMIEDIKHLLGYFTNDDLTRITIVRIK